MELSDIFRRRLILSVFLFISREREEQRFLNATKREPRMREICFHLENRTTGRERRRRISRSGTTRDRCVGKVAGVGHAWSSEDTSLGDLPAGLRRQGVDSRADGRRKVTGSRDANKRSK